MRAALLILLGACVDIAQSFHCMPNDNTACVDEHGVHGRCEATGNCSYPDPTCGAPGSRYGAWSDPGRPGICVLSSTGVSMTEPQAFGSSHALFFEVTTAMQIFVFDTAVAGTDAGATLHWFASPCPPIGSEITVAHEHCMSGNPVPDRITVNASSAGLYCVAATNMDASAHVGLRTFPLGSGSAQPCVQ